MLDSAGAADGAEEAGAVEAVDPPQAVRLSRAAAATPATVNVVRLNDLHFGFSFVVPMFACGELLPLLALSRLLGTDPWLVSQWVFGRSDGNGWVGRQEFLYGLFSEDRGKR